MGKRTRIGRNAACPCGSGLKYKRCCEGRIDWPDLMSTGTVGDVLSAFSVRGKNLFFLDRLAGALQLDKLSDASLPQFKRAFTPKAVREIYEATASLWTGMDDLTRGLRSEAEKSSALYVGMYDVGRILQGVTRHALYAERILLVDPFLNPMVVRPEYDPLLKPEEHAQNALRWSWLWLTMAPWIEADLVHFVRTPDDFDTGLLFKAMEITRERYSRNPELERLAKEAAESDSAMARRYMEETFLRSPDWYLRQLIEKALPGTSAEDEQRIIEAFHRQREANPFVLEPPQDGGFEEITQFSSGASYEMAKWTASISGSHLVTDITSRWAEIELDYGQSGLTNRHWSPFAKALNASDLRTLNAVPLDIALNLRSEGSLGSMRDFFSRVWRSARSDQEFAEENAHALSSELRHEMRVAEDEWKRIDRELVKWSATELAAGVVASGPAIASGTAGFLLGGLAVAGIGNLIWARLERRGFTKRHPAAFLLRLGEP